MRVRVLPGVPISRACGSTRTAEGPDSESGSLGGASPFMPTISRRLASAGTADPGDLKSPSLPGASPGSPTSLRPPSYGLASRRVVNREQQTGSTQDRTALGVQVSPRRPIGNVNRTSEPGLGANECVPLGMWCKSTVFRQPSPPVRRWRRLPTVALAEVGYIVVPARLRLAGHFCARSSKRAGGLIPRIALDQCRVPERYRTRAPLSHCGFRTADCGFRAGSDSRTPLFKSAIRNPRSAIATACKH